MTYMEQLRACFSAFQKQFGVFESTQNEQGQDEYLLLKRPVRKMTICITKEIAFASV